MRHSRWTAPPTRREFTLLLCAFTIFIISYNLNPSLHVIGLTPAASLQKLGLGSDPGFDPDGRRPESFRDDVEDLIFGDWEWVEGQVAGSPAKTQKEKATVQRQKYFHYIPPSVNSQQVEWAKKHPSSVLVKHIPGYSIIDSLILFNGTLYIVNDRHGRWPSLDRISAVTPSAEEQYKNELRFVSPEEAVTLIPPLAGSVDGVTLLSLDEVENQDSHTVISLLRTYSSLDTEITPDGATALAFPSRIAYPRIPYFSNPQPLRLEDGTDELTPRTRSQLGLPHSLMKSLLPFAGIMYYHDWLDLHESEIPYILERVVIADYKVATQASSGNGLPYWLAPFKDLATSTNWWEPVRSRLSRVMRVTDNPNEAAITYISRQDVESGPTLKSEDHDVLVKELQKLARDTKCTVKIVPHSASWQDKLSAILRSTVVLGVYGEHLFDSIYMKHSPRSTVMEFWPAGTFTRDVELPTTSTGLNYVAWWSDKKHLDSSLPPIIHPADASTFRQSVLIDARAIVQSIREVLSGR
ncbi:hypothetical protein BDM02DRAFT_3107363 [Thelephora ganbajun]|uniref:Uncharacterized protein n=1 Tax=Thelephora ganbajun TaxID=370292 RepID=A0ACB6ZVI0_THEGA|nr:hypothetical protein BDM02DRAFT_3107363 [Thelephora ganbajun]